MHIVRRSSHYDCQWSQGPWHYWFLQVFLQWFPWNFHYLVCIPGWEGHLWKSLQTPTRLLENRWRSHQDHEGDNLSKNSANQFHSWQRCSQLWILQPISSSQIIGIRPGAPFPFFAGKVQFRGALSNALTHNRLKDLEPDVDMTLLADWQIIPFVNTPFIQWWSEWQEHIFRRVANLYCITLNENYQTADDEVQNQTCSLCCITMFFIYF